MKRYIWWGPEQRSFCPPGAWGLAWWHWKHSGSPAFFIFLKKDQRAVLLGFHGDFNHLPLMTDSAQHPTPTLWKSGSRTESNSLLIIRFVPSSILPCPSSGDLPDPGIEPTSPALQADSLLLSHQVIDLSIWIFIKTILWQKVICFLVLIELVYYDTFSDKWKWRVLRKRYFFVCVQILCIG